VRVTTTGAIFTSFFFQPSIQQHRLIRRSFICQIHNALVISGKHNAGLAFFWELAGTFTQCTNVIPKLHPRHYKTSAVTPD
jgi:hypothetical protein